ncbi:hypothetical protein BDP27DRAFT_1422844 [Rhodocollybia butyracea]|uniref:DUF6532 domain-containing protein n=1 Tax=Rhodocollybia butyracea TaxID=206335 RepID=A0A9P5PKR0_9AGAR|nr:hypothetical protein BDP27DRAFT_1422844 [Rhodocollybia butyracea]
MTYLPSFQATANTKKPGPRTTHSQAAPPTRTAAKRKPDGKTKSKTATPVAADAVKKAQEAKAQEVCERAKAMAKAEANQEDDDVDPDLYGQGDDDLDGRHTSASLAEEGNDADLYEQDPDATVFKESLGDGGIGSDDEPHCDEDGDDDDDNTAAGMGHADDEMDVNDTPTNNIIVSSSPPVTPTKKAMARTHKSNRFSSSPASARSGHSCSSLSSNLFMPPSRRFKGKITNSNFTPNTLRVTLLGKQKARLTTAVKEPFPADKHATFLDVLQQVVKDNKDDEFMVGAFSRILASDDLQRALGLFGLFSGFIGKAREWVPSCFGIPGKMGAPAVKELVGWLLEDGRFKYGEIDTQGIDHMLCLEIFSTKGGAKIEVFKEIVKAGKITAPTLALMVTCIEHALSEYSNGVYRHAEFSDSARPRYVFHHESFKKIEKGAPNWANNFSTDLYKLIITQSNKSFLLDVEADDLKEVDIAGLEADAVQSISSPLPSSSPPQSSPIHA